MTGLPPERDLPGADRMVDNIVGGVAPIKVASARARYGSSLGVAAAVTLVALVGIVAVQTMGRGTSPVVPGSPTPTAPSTTSPEPSHTDPGPSSPDPTAPATPERPTGPVTLTADLGTTVQTRYFDVTVSALESDEDGLAWAAEVTVCYAAPHPEQNADGTTRTSIDPWSFSVQDGEAGGPAQWVKVRDLSPSSRWSPVYQTKLVKLGECNTGWVQAEPGNPDLFLPDLRYAPVDFGDDIRWERQS
ncbi:MAG TPA: hypothetical protein PKE40_00855 [Arachnia sp.]|nr:hypothetical protein [Arachnia sp.]HMT84876.1 hypothetical protein [Arachnia sp.]